MSKVLCSLVLCLLIKHATIASAATVVSQPAPAPAGAAMDVRPVGPSLAEKAASRRAAPRSARDHGRTTAGQPAAGPNKAASDRYTECVGLWDAGTHMSKPEWSQTCHRIENRLEHLQVENLDVDRTAPRLRREGRSPAAG
jgi:hypothetical protein